MTKNLVRFVAPALFLLLLGFSPLTAQEVIYSAGPTTGATNLQGLGFSWADVNKDGFLDLFVEPDNLVINNGGTSFTRRPSSGVPFQVAMVGSVFADFNGDTFPDVLTTQGTALPRLFYYNNTTGIFDAATGIGDLGTIPSGATSQMFGLAAGDYNGDGYVDIVWAGGVADGAANKVRLLRGGPNGFTSVGGAATAPAVIDTTQRFESWNAVFVDVNNDRRPDLFLPSIRNGLLAGTTPGSALYLNSANGTFSLPAPAAPGATASTGLVVGDTVRHYSAIASAFGDYDNDGVMDLAISALGGEDRGRGFRLLKGRGNGTFTEVTVASGITYNSACRALSWGDYNNDGTADLLMSRGFNPPTMWRNNGNGTFTDVTAAIGIPPSGFNTRSVGFIDYNSDGFLDFYAVAGGGDALWRNGGNLNNWIAFKAQAAGRNGIGTSARFAVYTNSGATKQFRDIEAGGSGGCTGGNVWANFGIGTAEKVDSVAVWWPDGSKQTFTGLAKNRYWTITQGSVVPSVPALASPADAATNQAGSLTLSWNAATGAVEYRVQVSLDQTFADAKKMAVDKTVTGTSLAVNLGLGSTYYWRVSATNGGFTSGYSAARNFSTVQTAATAVVRLVSPASNAANQAALLPLVIRRTADAAQYRYQVSTLRSFTAFTVNQLNVDTTNTVQLFSGTKYYWRARGENGLGAAAFSNIDSFTVLAAPPTPGLVFPANNAQNTRADTLVLRWRAVARASSYRVEVSRSSAGGLIVDTYTTADTSQRLLGLQRLTTYFWRVQASNIGGASLFSGSNSFITIIAAPAAPAAVAPAANAVNVSVRPTFSWNEVVTATKYRLQVAADNQFAQVVRDTVVFERTSVTLLRRLAGDTPYFWRVNAGNIGGDSPYSTARLFTTEIAVGVEEKKEAAIPTEFSLSQNYPNPFNPTTTIQFGLPKSSEVKLVVYDLSGRVVAELANGKFEAGYHKIAFDGARLVSGIYYYRLKAGDFLSVKKLTLLK
jgi:hypothetical protein